MTDPTSTVSISTPAAPAAPAAPPYHILPPSDPTITKFITAITNAFIATPLFLTFVSEVDDLPPTSHPSDITPARRVSYYSDGITNLARAGALLVESGDFSAVAIWEPPSFGTGQDFSSARKVWCRSSIEWTRRVKRARVRYLGVPGGNVPMEEIDERTEVKLRPFWHLGFLARDPEVEKVGGAVRAVVVPFLDRARQEGLPVWLEATTPEGVAMYTHFGFRLVETITVAVGERDASGWFKQGGEGVSGYCMIYDSHLGGSGS